MNGVRSYEGHKSTFNAEVWVTDPLVVETPLQIIINDEPLSITMQTPGNEEDLVTGLLYSEDIYRKKDEPIEVKLHQNEQGIIDAAHLKIDPQKLGKGYLNSRQLLSVSSCGICGRTAFNPVQGELKNSIQFNLTQIADLFVKMQSEQKIFALTGGCHSAAAFDAGGQLLTLREDIGRHNAVDKVIGSLLRKQHLHQAAILLVSGRVSYEIVSKCFMAGIPNLAAVSAPSSLAVDFAKELGIRLYAFCREHRMTLYS